MHACMLLTPSDPAGVLGPCEGGRFCPQRSSGHGSKLPLHRVIRPVLKSQVVWSSATCTALSFAS
eukprot:3614403-Amphidinium_carterae.1